MMPMKTECTKWKDALLNTALAGSADAELESHLTRCAECTRDLARLHARQQQIDTLLPLVARHAGPRPGFEARVLSAVAALDASRQTRSAKRWMRWTLAGATAALVLALAVQRRTKEKLSQQDLIAAQKLAQWRAPSDVLLQFPGQQIMQATPKLGESYLDMSLKVDLKK
jgi:anti-sigma factor RsiW